MSQRQFTSKEAALSFRKVSTPGPSGLRPKNLSVFLKGAPVNRTYKAGADLTRVVSLAVSPFLCGARIHAAVKNTRV